MQFRRLIIFCAIFAAAINPTLFAQAATPAQNQLAIVGVATYVDTTGSKNYGYLAESVTSAIEESMRQKFDFVPADKTTLTRQTQTLWGKKRVPLDADVKRVALLTRSDYLIVGSYSMSRDKKQIVFSTRVFVAPGKFIEVPSISNPTDATLFDATNKVATEIVGAIERDARQRQSEQTAQAKKAGEKISLSKPTSEPQQQVPEPKRDEELAINKSSRGPFAIGLSYHTNYFERQTQFYRYAANLWHIDAAYSFDSGFKIFGSFASPSSPTGASIPATSKNSSFWTLGIESDTDGYRTLGVLFRSFADPNPAAITVRDAMAWSIESYWKGDWDITRFGDVFFGIDLGAHFDIISSRFANSSMDNLFFLANMEGGLSLKYRFPIIGVFGVLNAGTSLGMFDQTSEILQSTGGVGMATMGGSDRSFKLSGLRLALQLSRSIFGINLRFRYVAFPNIASAYQPVNASNQLQSSASYITFGADYHFGR